MLTLYQVFLETVGVVILPGVAGPEVENAVVVVAAVSEVFVLGVDVVSVVFVVQLEVSEPGVVFVALVSVADVVEPQASVCIALAFDVLVPVSVFVVEVYSSGRPGYLPFPMSIILPALPVLLKSYVRNPFIVPPVSVPIMVSVVSSPARIYIKIKTWYSIIISPTPVIIM